jgi:hypothetical protein
VVSLLEMLRFYGDLFVKNLTRIIQWEVQCSRAQNPTDPLASSIAVEIFAYVGVQSGQFIIHGLPGASRKAQRIQEELKERHMAVSYSDMTSMLRELRERLEDDLHSTVFLNLSQQESGLYENPETDWGDVGKRFPKVRHDIEECSKCFALERYAAAVFHAMLIAEFGIIQVSDVFSATGDRPGWGALERLQRINDKKWPDKTPIEQQHAKFLETLLPLAFSMKNSWRHKMDHVANKIIWIDTTFDPDFAKDIISATSAFMRRLANDLPRTGV